LSRRSLRFKNVIKVRNGTVGMALARVLVVYDSESGNTEKMAFAVADGVKQVKNVDVVVKRVENASLPDLCSADGIIFGSPTYYGQMSGKLKTFIDGSVKIHGKLEGKVGAAFTSSGGTASGAETTLLSIIETMMVHGMVFQGRSDDKHYGPAALGAPHAKEIESCRELGRKVARLVLKLKG
jgi:NAD(P)H dehydrogenase (quinone)